MDAAESAVAEDTHHVAALHVPADVLDDGVYIREVGGGFATGLDVLHQLLGVQAFLGLQLLQLGDLGDDHAVGVCERRGEFVLENIPARGVRARLENGPDFLSGEFQAQRTQGLANGRGVMAEIIDDGNAAGDAADFHAALDALEGAEGTLNLAVLEAAMFRGGDDGQRVAHVEFADHVEMELRRWNLELAGGGAELEVEGAHGVGLAEAEAFHGTVRDVEQLREVRVVAVAEELAVARDEPDEVREGFLDRGEVVEDVGVIEFEVVDDRDLGQVVDELAALVEERGVVLVALDDEPFAVREACAGAEIVRNAADEIGRVQPVVLKDPGEERGGGRAVSYSSPSRMNHSLSVKRAPWPKLFGMPPMR